jgi:hypothetical protein
MKPSKLKFMLWDKIHSCWHGGSADIEYGLTGRPKDKDRHQVMMVPGGTIYNLHLWTGVKDKKGRDIFFNSDILKYGESTFIVCLFGEYGIIDPHIEWLNRPKDWSYSEWAYDHAGDCEIVRNIYERTVS